MDQSAYRNNWISEKLDRINLTVPKGQKEAIKAHAEKNGESVNGFIKRAIMEVTEMDNMHRAYQRSLLRQLEHMQKAMEDEDYTEAKRILDGLIEDTKSSLV